jgi:hypothetical protein
MTPYSLVYRRFEKILLYLLGLVFALNTEPVLSSETSANYQLHSGSSLAIFYVTRVKCVTAVDR